MKKIKFTATKLGSDERWKVEEAARVSGVSMSAFIRDAAVRAAERVLLERMTPAAAA